jgi:hypothetical protein
MRLKNMPLLEGTWLPAECFCPSAMIHFANSDCLVMQAAADGG